VLYARSGVVENMAGDIFPKPGGRREKSAFRVFLLFFPPVHPHVYTLGEAGNAALPIFRLILCPSFCMGGFRKKNVIGYFYQTNN
jgi:hypothetical protein